MANTKVTSRVLADDAVGLAQLNISNDPSNGQALTYVQSSNDLQWATISSGVAGISSSADATAITIDSSERVGINQSSPAARLHVFENSAEIARFEGNDEFAYIGLRGTVSGSATSLGYFGFANDSGTAADLNITNAQDGDITFRANSAEHMRIHTNGHVGIGTTINDSLFQIESTSTTAMTIQAGTNSSASVRLKNDAVDWDVNCQTNDNFAIYSHTASAERLVIDGNGRIFLGNGSTTVGTADLSYLGPSGSDTTLQIMCPDNTPGREIQLRLTNNNATYYGYGAAFRAVQGGGINSYTLYIETNATGGVYLSGGGTSWSSNSDERYKTIIEDIDNASEKVSTLRTVIGTFNDDADQKRRPFLIAQDVQAVLPEAVDDTANPDRLGLSYTDVIPLLTAAIKEQKIIIDDLKTRIETLEDN